MRKKVKNMPRKQQKAVMSKYVGYGISKGRTPDGIVYYENVGKKRTGGYEFIEMNDTYKQAKRKHEQLMKRSH